MKKILLLAIVSMATLLNADNILKYNMDGEIMEFYYKNSKTSKMVTNSEDGKVEIYNTNKNSYIVNHSQDGITVVDANKLKARASAMGFDASAYMENEPAPEFKIKKTGKFFKVAGIKGELWILKGSENGESFQEKVVVTKNKKVVRTVRAMVKSLSSMSGDSGDMTFFEPKKGYVTIRANGMKLESFKTKKLSSKTYKVPKSKQNRSQYASSRNSSKKKNLDEKPLFMSQTSCYDNVCCGKKAGEAVVLKRLLKGYSFIDSASCTDTKGASRVESAIYYDYNTNNKVKIYVSLIFNDKNQGRLHKAVKKYGLNTFQQVGKMSLRNSINSKNANYNIVSQFLIQEHYPKKEAIKDVFIGDATYSTTAILHKNLNYNHMSGSTSRNILWKRIYKISKDKKYLNRLESKEKKNFKAYNSQVKSAEKNQPKPVVQKLTPKPKPTPEPSIDINQAAGMLKGFF